eukprot:CAMPEP_0183753346 /NCGR_PEP_ID=MMETSP0739-20130205/2881_1 /TAXON_ID=385413 /ORGANISM="Thalassiosira miniscula, Strain CCMP1093" /LENGTH=229 /DNA_ID=CAMNT_0025989815 /DNA_START=524 /DNA_END=1213 /DNA_ORIENTATION=-
MSLTNSLRIISYDILTTSPTLLRTIPGIPLTPHIHCPGPTGTSPRTHPHLDPITLIRHINLATFDIPVNFLGGIYERLFDIVRRLGTRFHKDETVFIGERLALLGGYRAAMFEIVLVPDEHDDHVGLTVLPGFLEPSSKVFEGVPSGDVVDKEGAGGAAVVGSGDGSEGFLSGRVPYLKLDRFIRNINHTCAEFDANGEVMDRLEAFVGELKEEAGFANSCITNDNIFE